MKSPARDLPQWGDGVGLQETGPLHVVMVRADGDLMLEQSSGPSAAQALAPIASPLFLQQPVDSGRANLEQLPAHRLLQRSVLRFVGGQPQRQGRLEPLAAQLLGSQPEGLEGRIDSS
jgi:hypothetical protein